MTKKRVSVHALQKHADQIATITGKERGEVLEKLKKSHELLGIEIDLNPPAGGNADLNFGGKTDLERTRPFERPRLEQPFQA